ncbi:MAG TPA: hydrogen peroxide-inducible genes activator [Planctomycetota bacterium]|nr:hydrogen peroxide-inducible genes activator [Planctomycetota bacterium]
MAAIDGIFDPKATTLPVLRYLVALADHHHFGRAAAACGVSQPTLSAQIQQWERRMAMQAFERSGSGVRTTPAGERVVAQARAALAALEALEHAAGTATPPFFGPVRLGVIPTVGPYALPFLAHALEARWPDLDLPIVEGTTAEMVERLDRGRIDLALMAVMPGLDAGHEVVALYDEPFLAALPKRHALARADEVTPAELAGERLLLLDEGHCLREQALELCRLRGDARRTGADYGATSLETLKSLVALGRGVTLLPALATGDDERIALRPISGRRTRRTIAVYWRRNDPRGDAYRELASVMRTSVPRDRVQPAR